MKKSSLLAVFSVAGFLLSPLSSPAATKWDLWIGENLDYLRSEEGYLQSLLTMRIRSQPDEIDDPNLEKVIHDFGPSVIPMAKLPMSSGVAEAEQKVWSSYWYPSSDTLLFKSEGGEKSALEKYDQVRAFVTGKKSAAAAFAKKQYDQGGYSGWDGLCDSWSIAANLLAEPVEPITVPLKGHGKVTFSVSEQKALLFLSFDGLSPRFLDIYGQKFTGEDNRIRDGLSYGNIQADIFPEQFHRFIEIVLFQQKRPFVMDHEAKDPIWSEPVHRANYRMEAVRGRADLVLVTTHLYPAKQLRKEERDQPGFDQTTRTYQYLLGGNLDNAGNLVVTWGSWVSPDWIARNPLYKDNAQLRAAVTESSREDHPDYLFTVHPEALGNRHPMNPEIEPYIVDGILKGKVN